MDNNEPKKCPRDCRQCSLYQQVFCAAQSALNAWDAIIALNGKFEAFVGEIKGNVEQPIVSPAAQEREAVQKIDSPDKPKKEQL